MREYNYVTEQNMISDIIDFIWLMVGKALTNFSSVQEQYMLTLRILESTLREKLKL